MNWLRLAPSLVLVASSAAASLEVLVVDGDPLTSSYVTIQEAVDDAQSGDTVLVRPLFDEAARYDGFVIDGKGLTVRGERHPLLLTGTVAVRGVPLGQTVILRGLDMNRQSLMGIQAPSSDTSGPGLTVEDSPGAVRVVDCSMEGSVGIRVWAGLQLFDALDVTLDGCTVLGTSAPNLDEAGGSGLQAIASRLSIFGCEIIGGRGASSEGGFVAYGGSGGTGAAFFARSVAWIAESTVRGGKGGAAECGVYTCDDYPGEGGVGLQVTPGSIVVESRATLEGGPGGERGFNSFGGPGPAGQASSGTYMSNPTTHVSAQVESAFVRDRSTASPSVRLTVMGEPGQSARVAVARQGGYRFFGATRGVLQVTGYVGSTAFLPIGTFPASGVITADVPLPSGAADASTAYFLQVAVDVGPSQADFRLSGPITVEVDGVDVPTSFDRVRAYVNASAAPGGDGESWATACRSIEEGLLRLPWTSGGEVWVQEGTFVVSGQAGISIPSHVRLIGGFAGTETSASQADPRAHPSVLSGDRDGSGSFTENDAAALLRIGRPDLGQIAEGVELIGLRFTGANDLVGYHSGAVQVRGDLLVESCSFVQNNATPLYSQRGRLSVRRSQFIGNAGRSYGAIGAFDWIGDGTSSSLDVESCVFNGNRSVASGAGTVHSAFLSSARVNGSTFHANSGPGGTVAILCVEIPSVWISNNILHANSEYVYPFGNPKITDQIYLDDIASMVFQYNSVDDLRFLWNVNGNVVGDPGFVNRLGADGQPGNLDDDLQLAPGSHAIDAGNSLYLPPWAQLDVEGEPRRKDDPATLDTGVGGAPVVDMGALER